MLDMEEAEETAPAESEADGKADDTTPVPSNFLSSGFLENRTDGSRPEQLEEQFGVDSRSEVAEEKLEANESGRTTSSTSDAVKEELIVSASCIPQTKKNPKKTLKELHQQLLKKLDPNLIPSGSASLPEILRSGSNNDVVENPTYFSNDVGENKTAIGTDVGENPTSISNDVGKNPTSVSNHVGENPTSISNQVGKNPTSISNDVGKNPTSISNNVGKNLTSISQQPPGNSSTVLKSLAERRASNSQDKNLGNIPDGRSAEKGLYRCSIDNCWSSFNRVSDLKIHVNSAHPDVASFPCSFCFDAFDSFEMMADHLKTHIKNVFKCSHCQTARDSKEDLLNHISTEHTGQAKKITIYVKILNNERQKKASKMPDSGSLMPGSGTCVSGNSNSISDSDNSILGSGKSILGSGNSTPGNASSIPGDGNSLPDQPHHDGRSQPNIEADKPTPENATTDRSSSVEVTRSQRSRKSTKPVKCRKDPTDDVVHIFSAKRNMNISCDRCSFRCESSIQLQTHRVDSHGSSTGAGWFRCKVCRFSTDVKSVFQRHIMHHEGRHVIRYYICPYCKIDTNSMDMVEDHVGDKHPSEAFRFEVLQETIEFLQNLLECPVCRGSFSWKTEFIQHVQNTHRLDDLAEYLEGHFSGAFPAKGFVPKSLFRNLLPETADFEELPPEPMVVSSDEEGPAIAEEDEKERLERLDEAVNICVEKSGSKDGKRIFRFSCQTCNYASCDYDDYVAHFKSHGTEKSESLIKKLLTKSTTPSLPLEQTNDPDLTLDIYRSPPDPSAAVGNQKTKGAFRCHLCPFQCTKTVHFKRHLAIHTRNETLKEGYKCGYCQFAHYRLNCVKFHLGKYHGNYPNKMIRIVDGIEIELGADDDPGKIRKTPLIMPSISAPVLRTASEKRPTARYEESRMPTLQRSASRNSPMVTDPSSLMDSSLTDFELQLPAQMIYPEPVKCPKCDFTNRVRINLVRHLKLHREEGEPSGFYDGPSPGHLQESSLLRTLMVEDTARPATTKGGETVSSHPNKKSHVLDEKPLLRSILCEKPRVKKAELEEEESENSNCGSTPSEDFNRRSSASRSTAPKDLSDFSIRLPTSDLYQCKECSFVHRFPSKVKRHYCYKHISVFPYKCGYCTFEAVESGKVRRHCQQMHRTQPELVVKSARVELSASKGDDGKSGRVLLGEEDDVVIVDEMISGEGGDGKDDRWLAQFVIDFDCNLRCCKLCGFQEEGASSLKRHVYTKHLRLYPFSCKYCGVALAEIHRVKRHVEKHHPGLPLIVIQRHFEELAVDDGERIDLEETVYVKEEEEDEEAPQLDFYPKSEDFGVLLDSAGARDEVRVNGPSSGKTETEMPSFLDGNDMEADEVGADEVGADEVEADELEAYGVSGSHRRLFKCVYCGIISKWNRRDIRLHIMHVHLRRRVYTCRHCCFGNSKSKAVVKSHCAKYHPNKPVSVRDDLALFNAVVPIEDKNGIVTMAFSSSTGVPILNLEEVDNGETKKAATRSLPQKLPNSRTKSEEAEVGVTETRRSASSSTSRKGESPLDLSSRHSGTASRTNSPGKKTGKNSAATVKTEPVTRERTEWRCKLCGFINQNASHVKYHLICYHMKLKPFSCPYCHLYIWKSQGVVNHIEKHHPGREKKIFATVDEKSTYISSNMEKVLRGSGSVEKKVTSTVVAVNESFAPAPKVGYFRCGICGYQDARNDKTKYHIIKQHLKLRQFSCPHCHLYMWGRQQVIKHIEEEHPGMEISITRTFQEYEEYLKQTITKVSGPPAGRPSDEEEEEEEQAEDAAVSSFQRGSRSTSPPASLLRLCCNKCSFVTDSEMSLSAHKRSHRMFQCFHCDFRHMLAAKVQIHCLMKHPNKLVKYRQCDTSLVEPAGDDCTSTKATPTARQNEVSSTERKGSKLFHPCDVCPVHFETALELEKHLSSEHHGMYICNYCHIVLWNSASMQDHLRQSHPTQRPDFRLIKKEPNDSTVPGTRKRPKPASDFSEDEEEPSRKFPKLEHSDVSMSPDKLPQALDQSRLSAGNDSVVIYKCRLCNYRSGKVTVMRHHAMSHLRYHPYLCPYCDLVRSVKSFPITKHVRSKHPNCELKFFYARNEDMEVQVKNSYHRVRLQSKKLISGDAQEPAEDDEDFVETSVLENPGSTSTKPASMLHSMLPRKVLYKCTFCSLKTHIRTDMKHHLMREIQYKPYRCVYCTYTEPCKWSMRKHFRTKHGGIDVAVEDMRDAENDARVEKLLEKCTVLLKHTVDPELLAWKPSSTPQRRVHGHPETQRSPPKPKVAPTSAFLLQKPGFGTSSSLGKRPFTKSMAIKFHRCPHCTYTNTSIKLVRGHMVKHGPFRLQCGYCDYRGHYPSRIRKHMRRHHPMMPFKCTKVALPPKEERPEEIPVIHVPGAQVKAQNKPAPGTVFLDGVPMDIPLIPDDEGWFRCLQCDYQSVNREHFKMHVVIHRPPKWKCFYCDQKYPVIFRLRRHSNSKHPNLPIKWVDVETGQLSVDSLKPASLANKPWLKGRQAPRETARKSTSKGAHLQVAMFRANRKPEQRNRKRSPSPNSDSDSTVVDKTPFVIGEPYTLAKSDSDASDSNDGTDFSVNLASSTPKLCCHLCSFSTSIRSTFTRHLDTSHPEMNSSLVIEVLPNSQGSEVIALHHCGFCSYDSYDMSEFEAHVREHTKEVPVCCEYCNFASFIRRRVEEHVLDEHPDLDVCVRELRDHYTMSNDDLIRRPISLEVLVQLEDIMKIPELDFESFLAIHQVAYQRPDI